MSVTGHYKVMETLSTKIAAKRRSLNEQGTEDCYDRCARENVPLLAAGYATVCRETSLDDPGMSQLRAALEIILRQREPRSAFALARNRNLVMPNECYVRFLTVLSVWSLRACRRSRPPPCRAVESALPSVRSEGRPQNDRKLGSDRQITRSAQMEERNDARGGLHFLQHFLHPRRLHRDAAPSHSTGLERK
jgi:hypothetical protein